MPRRKLLLIFSFLILILLSSCALKHPMSKIDITSDYSWEEEAFVLRKGVNKFLAMGNMHVWIDDSEYNLDYETFTKNLATWRIDIFGPFHVHGATFIIKGIKTYVFRDDAWEESLWPEVSLNMFGMILPYKILSIMFGGEFTFKGVCTPYNDGKLCKEHEFFYFLKNNKILEIKSSDISVVMQKGSWYGSQKDGKFIIRNKSTEQRLSIDESIFIPASEEKDLLDEI